MTSYKSEGSRSKSEGHSHGNSHRGRHRKSSSRRPSGGDAPGTEFKVMVRCRHCGVRFRTNPFAGKCPKCGASLRNNVEPRDALLSLVVPFYGVIRGMLHWSRSPVASCVFLTLGLVCLSVGFVLLMRWTRM